MLLPRPLLYLADFSHRMTLRKHKLETTETMLSRSIGPRSNVSQCLSRCLASKNQSARRSGGEVRGSAPRASDPRAGAGEHATRVCGRYPFECNGSIGRWSNIVRARAM